MLQSLTPAIAAYGYAVVAVCILLESMGLPFPGEAALLVAGAYAGAGHLDIGGVMLVAVIAAIMGGTGGYWIGRSGGRRLLVRYGRWFFLNEHRLQRIERFYAAHGTKTVFFGRFVSIVRTYIALFAGISHMHFGRFTFFNVLGGLLWSILFTTIGALFGANLDRLERWISLTGWGMFGAVVLLAALVFLWTHFFRRRPTQDYEHL